MHVRIGCVQSSRYISQNTACDRLPVAACSGQLPIHLLTSCAYLLPDMILCQLPSLLSVRHMLRICQEDRQTTLLACRLDWQTSRGGPSTWEPNGVGRGTTLSAAWSTATRLCATSSLARMTASAKPARYCRETVSGCDDLHGRQSVSDYCKARVFCALQPVDCTHCTA